MSELLKKIDYSHLSDFILVHLGDFGEGFPDFDVDYFKKLNERFECKS